MPRILGSILVLLVSACICGCDSDNDPTVGIDPSDVSLHGNVYKRGGGGVQISVLHRGEPLSDLEVTVNGHQLRELPAPGNYLITETSIPIRPDLLYELSVPVGNGHISATTELCDSLRCIVPEEYSVHRVREPLFVRWSTGGPGFKYVLVVEQLFAELFIRKHVSRVITDTSYVVPSSALDDTGTYWIGVFCFEGGILYSGRVLGFEQNNLVGGADGFFGSWRVAEVRVSLEE